MVLYNGGYVELPTLRDVDAMELVDTDEIVEDGQVIDLTRRIVKEAE